MLFTTIISLSAVALASAPPDTCDVELINECLDKFEVRFKSCDDNDLKCQCESVIKDGANCYAACPQEALTKFIKTYSDGKCASYDPYLSRREVVQHIKLSEAVEAITVTPSDPTTTISLSPQEYQSRLEKEQYRENLKSIRSERARISKEADNARTAPQAVNKQASMEMTSTAPATSTSISTSTAQPSSSASAVPKSKNMVSKEKNSGSKVLHSIPLLALGVLPAAMFF